MTTNREMDVIRSTKTMRRRLCMVGGGLLLSAAVSILPAAQDATAASDNTKANQEAANTADQQKESKADREFTRHIRKSLVDDKTLSTYAHSVKIIAINGVVTLRGPVRSEEEKTAVEAKAKSVAGVTDVRNELTVAPKRR